MDANRMEPWRNLEPFLGADVPRNEVVLLSEVKAMCAALTAELAAARVALAEAADDIESWAAYAAPYFHQKHGLSECVAKYRAIAATQQGNDSLGN